jgi:phospholipase C
MTASPGVEHVIVLMLENRSFDHFLGWSYGLTGAECNQDPGGPAGKTVNVSQDATFNDPEGDPDHEFSGVQQQLDLPSPNAPTNGGFVTSYRDKLQRDGANPDAAGSIMRCFAPSNLPVLTRLAAEFSVCTNWFSSMPGPTWPNRYFLHAAQSGGVVANQFITVRTIFDNLSQAGRSSRIYFHDIPQAFAIGTILDLWLNKNPHFSVRRFREFAKDVARGELAHYTFIEPQYFEVGDFSKAWQRTLYRILAKLGIAGGLKANDQHPPHDVRMGERLIKDVYETIAESKKEYWRNTMVVVLYDEHGGLYDSRRVPSSTDPVPAGPHASGFSFDRYGVRVPAVVVSPYVAQSSPDTALYDHSSVCKTLKECFGLPDYLTKRDESANPIAGAFPTDQKRGPWPKLDALPVFPYTRDKKRPPSDLQLSLHKLASQIAARPRVQVSHPTITTLGPAPSPPESEPEARRYVQQVMKALVD